MGIEENVYRLFLITTKWPILRAVATASTFLSGELMRTRQRESSRGVRGQAPPRENCEFKSSEMAGNASKINKRGANYQLSALKKPLFLIQESTFFY